MNGFTMGAASVVTWCWWLMLLLNGSACTALPTPTAEHFYRLHSPFVAVAAANHPNYPLMLLRQEAAAAADARVQQPAVASGPLQDNDRSVYDPGVVENLPLSALIDDFAADDFPNVVSASGGMSQDNHGAVASDDDDDEDDNDENIPVNDVNLLTKLRQEIKEDEDIAVKSAVLLKMLEISEIGATMPIVYVEEPDEAPDAQPEFGLPDKRAGRYYRRYPWKRQNTARHRTYESEQRYLCVPSRDDVFKLLVGLHDNRNGNQNRTVNFCNRKRPAKAIFTNIRFLG